jgi:hypothetical protein
MVFPGCPFTFSNRLSSPRAFGWQLKQADGQRGKEITRQPPVKMLKYAGEI